MERSSVVDSVSGGSVVDSIRTSSGTFLAPNQDDVLAAVQMRVAELAMLPQENQEALQVRLVAGMDLFCLNARLTCAAAGAALWFV
jgi:hypothetical protein